MFNLKSLFENQELQGQFQMMLEESYGMSVAVSGRPNMSEQFVRYGASVSNGEFIPIANVMEHLSMMFHGWDPSQIIVRVF